MRTLYPEIEPYETGMLDVGAGQAVYWEVSGNPDGKPVVFLHGGPGGGTDPFHRQFFDPAAYKIVLLDQRGCGRSTPHIADGASLETNTTAHLIADIEILRIRLGIDRWQVFGGSWGSTLALAYAQQHPDRVTELVLRGIFLLRRKEIDWYYNGAAGNIYPDEWEKFLAPVPEDERDSDLVQVYHRLLHSPTSRSPKRPPSPGPPGRARRVRYCRTRIGCRRVLSRGSRWPSPGSRTTTSSMADSSTRDSCCAISTRSRTSRPSSCRVATTSSARRPALGSCIAPGPDRYCTSWTMPVTPPPNPE